MTSAIEFLKKHIAFTCILLLGYYILVVTMHQEFGMFVANTLEIPLGRNAYNLVILGIFGSLLMLFLIWLVRGLKNQAKADNKTTILYLFFTLVLIIASFNIIMVVNIELIHVLQYAVFAILLFSLIGRYFDVLFWTTVFGALDELYQYVYLAPNNTDYYDLNDVIINMSGAALGLVLLRSKGIRSFKKPIEWFKSSWFIGTTGLFILIFGLWIMGELTFYPNGDLVLFEFIRDFTPGFWRKIPPKVLFHVVQPFEGLIILISLFVIYSKIALKRLNPK